jgi:hypothetical protein
MQKLEVERVEILLRTQRSQFRTSARRLDMLTKALSRFPDKFQDSINSDHYCFLSYPLQFIYHETTNY